MKPDNTRNQASHAVIALREAMGMTQQRFAVEALGSALNTVARYETTNPPRGEALLRLAAIAQAAAETPGSDEKLRGVADWFLFLYFSETLGNQTARLVRFGNEAWLVTKLKDDQIDAAVDFLEIVAPVQAQNARRNLKARANLEVVRQIKDRVTAGDTDKEIAAALPSSNPEAVAMIAAQQRELKRLSGSGHAPAPKKRKGSKSK